MRCAFGWRRGNRGKRTREACPFSLSIDPLYGVRGSFTQGGARGGKARLESDQMSRKALPCKACVEHPTGTCFASRREATIFVPQGGTKITTFFRNAFPSVSVYMGGKIKQLVYKYPLLLSGGLYYNSKLPV